MAIKNFIQFLNEADAAPAPPPAQAPPAQAPPAAQAPPPAQPMSFDEAPVESGTTAQQPAAQTTQQPQGEQKPGDLSNYDNPSATKFSDTVKKMVDMVKDLDKQQLIELRGLLAKFKSIDDEKSEIGKL
jgi:hypothetical protein